MKAWKSYQDEAALVLQRWVSLLCYRYSVAHGKCIGNFGVIFSSRPDTEDASQFQK